MRVGSVGNGSGHNVDHVTNGGDLGAQGAGPRFQRISQFSREIEEMQQNPTQPKFLVSARKATKIHASEDVQHDISKF